MDIEGMMMHLIDGVARDVETPPWMVGERVCPVLMGDDLWWRSARMLVKGMPPTGTRFAHTNPHRYPAAYGPVGTPIQVVPDALDYFDDVAMVDLHGQTHTRLGQDVLELVMLCHPGAQTMWYYPAQEADAPPPSLVVMATRRAMEGDRHTFERDGVRFALSPVAFLRPTIHRLAYFLAAEERDCLPRFDGERGLGPGHDQ